MDAKIPQIGFGTYRLKEDDIKVALPIALEANYVHIDTAALYKNEKFIGDVLKKLKVDRSKLWITTKIDKFSINGGRKAVEKSLMSSLENLGTNYLDLVLLHAPGDSLELDLEAWIVLEEYQKKKIIRHIGVSNYKEKELKNLMDNATVRPYTNQIEISPFWTREQLVKYCHEHKIIITAHSSLTKGEKFNDKTLQEIASKYKASPAQILLKWARQKGYVVIPRSHRRDHIIENISLNFEISDDDMAKLDKLNANFATHSQYL
jgi:methylglyoxal/glyoxal reductase